MNKMIGVKRKILTVFATAAVLASSFAGIASAAPFNAASNNPNVVAFYPSGDHGVVGENANHNGTDLVMRAGQSGNFQQWFYGQALEGPNGSPITEGDHSLWKVSRGGTCPAGSFALQVSTDPNSNNFWGDYLEDGATYCVRTNDFHVQK